MGDEILEIVVDAVTDLNQSLQYDSLKRPGRETILYGSDSELDSLSLVLLISTIEEAVSRRLGCDILLASERAMSMRHSPYRTVGSLTEFIAAELAMA